MFRWGLGAVVAFVSTCSLACASGAAGGSAGETDSPDGASALDSTAAEGGFDAATADALGDATVDSAVAPADDAGADGDSGSEAGGVDSGTTPETGGNDAASAPDADAGPSFNGGTYHLVNAATGFLADVYQGSTSPGTEVIQYHSDSGTNQQWTFVASTGGAGSYILFNRNSNLVLDITGPNVIQATASGSASQNWVVSPGSTAGFYVFASGSGMGLLTTQGSSEGAQLLVQPANGTTTQEWQIAP